MNTCREFKPESRQSKRLTETVLFLCTGNYYRSRFAEELFNHSAKMLNLPFRALSLGFTPHPDINPGSISDFTIQALKKLDINPIGANRMPEAVQSIDFESHQYCVALCEREHRPMMERMFPQFLPTVRFWNIEDLAFESSEKALHQIQKNVEMLLTEIQSNSIRG